MKGGAETVCARESGGRRMCHAKPARLCPDGVPAGEGVFEKLLEMTLPLALAIGIWCAFALPWGAPA